MDKVQLRFDDAVSQLRLATEALLEEHPEYLDINIRTEGSPIWAVSDIARVTQLACGYDGWRNWAEHFTKWLAVHTDYRIAHKDDIKKPKTN